MEFAYYQMNEKNCVYTITMQTMYIKDVWNEFWDILLKEIIEYVICDWLVPRNISGYSLICKIYSRIIASLR